MRQTQREGGRQMSRNKPPAYPPRPSVNLESEQITRKIENVTSTSRILPRSGGSTEDMPQTKTETGANGDGQIATVLSQTPSTQSEVEQQINLVNNISTEESPALSPESEQETNVTAPTELSADYRSMQRTKTGENNPMNTVDGSEQVYNYATKKYSKTTVKQRLNVAKPLHEYSQSHTRGERQTSTTSSTKYPSGQPPRLNTEKENGQQANYVHSKSTKSAHLPRSRANGEDGRSRGFDAAEDPSAYLPITHTDTGTKQRPNTVSTIESSSVYPPRVHKNTSVAASPSKRSGITCYPKIAYRPKPGISIFVLT